MTDTFFISLAYLKANTPINNNVDNETIRPFIALCMDKYILNVLRQSFLVLCDVYNI